MYRTRYQARLAKARAALGSQKAKEPLTMAKYPAFTGRGQQELDWYVQAKRMWCTWGHTLDATEKKIWLEGVPDLKLSSDGQYINEHRFYQGRWRQHVSWSRWTFLKILFSPSVTIKSRCAIWVQKRFPDADLSIWEFNNKGPTVDLEFRNSPFFPRLQAAIKQRIEARVKHPLTERGTEIEPEMIRLKREGEDGNNGTEIHIPDDEYGGESEDSEDEETLTSNSDPLHIRKGNHGMS
ncbi:hypothetical protein BGZ63DRAFT_193110 [Mariannaea sp. PMI_226]|nr:hypothetical protein BGZ63DRAFT_193110 [Mariannaea sp. PMI_226]